MEIIQTKLAGVYVLKFLHFKDERGGFVKTFHAGTFKENGLDTDFRESYFSTSEKNVIRGMHFQLPPHEHSKLVYVTHGKVLDVVLDIRKDSATFGDYITVELSNGENNAIYISKGLAHGFCVPEDNATMVYMTSTVYNKDFDAGIKWDSFGFDWPVKNPLISERDRSFVSFKDFESPF